ncbi:MAG: toxin-antitoxin system YwqK family antitoxin [Helicobacteraceae bacterium]|jgi:hypothetical protein|nr:toxin-antitoxin system YwqK family antitoxin [Helicobacteraceae bacterium]
MKRILISALPTDMRQSADADYKIYIVGETARFDEGKGGYVDMDGNLLIGKTDVRMINDGVMLGMFCIDGKPYGALRTYYESGALKVETPLKDDKIEGVVKGFYESGKLKAEEPRKNDKLEGVAKYFYENGKLEKEIPYKNGVIDGTQKIYYESGKLRQEIAYKNGVQEGKMRAFRENGAIFGVFTYKKDKPISGVCHKTNGKKRPFTEAELENWNNGLNITCE